MGDITRALMRYNDQFGGDNPKRRAAVPPPASSEQADDGLIRIKGSGAAVVSLQHSHSASYSRTIVKESSQIYDEIRIKNPDDKSQHVDVKRPKKITKQQPRNYFPTAAQRRAMSEQWWAASCIKTCYAEQKEEDNIEILRRNVKEKNPNYRG